MIQIGSRELTRETMLKGNPCWDYRERFAERFPVSVNVTVELAMSQSEDWDWDWAASKLLTREGFREFGEKMSPERLKMDQSLKDYRDLKRRTHAEARAVYDEALSKLRDGHGWYISNPQWDVLDDEYVEYVKMADAAFNAAWNVAIKRTNLAMARIWAEIYISEEGKLPRVLEDEKRQQEYDDEPCECYSCREARGY